MASRVQKIMFWDTLKKLKSVILHFFPGAEIGRKIYPLYFSYPQEIYSQFVARSVYFSVLLLQIAGKHPVLFTLYLFRHTSSQSLSGETCRWLVDDSLFGYPWLVFTFSVNFCIDSTWDNMTSRCWGQFSFRNLWHAFYLYTIITAAVCQQILSFTSSYPNII